MGLGGPPGLNCYICGGKYGTSSLQIHIKQCKEKFLAIESKKPKDEWRRLPPEPNLDFDEIWAGNFDESKFNDEMFWNYNDNALVPCEICSWTFLPDALKHHMIACQKGIFRKWVKEDSMDESKPFERKHVSPLRKQRS